MRALPPHGRDRASLIAELEAAKAGDVSWRDARMAVYFYHLDEEVTRVAQEAYLAYWTENAMGTRAFPSVKRLEDEVVGMGLSLLQAPEGAAGTFTSGGSESIFLAVKAARDRAREEKGIARGNIVLPRSAHPTFDRAAHYLGLEVRRVPGRRNDRRADVDAMATRIDAATVLLVGSAPCYPFGVFDPIADIAALATARGIWMHVDACVGGFLAPFVRRLGRPIPAFDFAVPGVTSISADLHKHGYTAKGASLLLLRDAALLRHQHFSADVWERGPYAQPTTQGSRPAGAVASAWAVMNFLGEEGYTRWAALLMETTDRFAAGIAAIPGLAVLEPHDLCILVYRAEDPALDIGAVAEAMGRRGWLVGRQAEPDGVHLHLNPQHAVAVDAYLADLSASVEEARASGAKASAPAGRTY